MPECLCFIFECIDDYSRFPDCQNRIDPVPKDPTSARLSNHFYLFIRDKGYESVDGKFVRQRDHDLIIGYDDIDRLFWYSEDIAHILLTDKVRLTFGPNGADLFCQTRIG
jgi:1,3-beta-glucan synthase